MPSILTIIRQRRHRGDQVRSSAQQRTQRTVLGLGFIFSAGVVILVISAALAYAALTHGLPSLDQLTRLLKPSGRTTAQTDAYSMTALVSI